MHKLRKDKYFKEMIDGLEDRVGFYTGGMLIAFLNDAIDYFTKDSEDGRYMRTVEITFNDFFSLKLDIENEKYIGVSDDEEN